MNVALVSSTISGSGWPQPSNHQVVIGAVILLLVALAGVLLAVRGTSYFVKGLGIGLAIGWALISILSAGICTGLDPYLYTGRNPDHYYSAPPL